MSDKIGVGIITCNRPEFFKKCYNALFTHNVINNTVNNIIVVNDGEDDFDIEFNMQSTDCKYIKNETNLGVCKSKNIALKHLIKEGCDHIFLIEDDIIIKSPNTLQKYITASKRTGIQHLMFGYHGPANRGGESHGIPSPKTNVTYPDGTKLSFNPNCVGAFCYYSRKALEAVGLFDEKFDKNCWEHVEHTYRISKIGMTSPYWWWADVANSYELLDEQACSEENSSIRKHENWQKDLYKSSCYFKEKHGYYPFGLGTVPNMSYKSFQDIIKMIYINFAENVDITAVNKTK